MITDSDFQYADWLLNEWARWVKSEYMGTSLDRRKSTGHPLMDDTTCLAIDMSIARCDESTRKLIKRIYLWNDLSISPEVLKRYIEEFMRAYHAHVEAA